MKTSRSLRLALRTNAAFSLLSGATFIWFAPTLAAFVSPRAAPLLFVGVGLGLLVFGALVGSLGLRSRPDPWLALWVSLADLAWVGGTALLFALAWRQLTPGGIALLGGIAALVLGLALAQLRGIARSYATPQSGAYRICLEVHHAGRADTIWRNLSDLAAISRYAAALSFSRLRDPAVAQVGAVRECGDRQGRRWAERCKRFDAETREIVADFLVAEAGNPFPFSELEGGWSVRDAAGGHGAVVTVWLRGTPKPRLLAPLLLPVMDWQSRRTFGPTIQRLAEEPGATAPSASPRWTLLPC